MAFDFSAPLERLVEVLEALPGMPSGAVHTGVPKEITHPVGAYAAVSQVEIIDKANQLLQAVVWYEVMLLYSVDQNTLSASELGIAGMLGPLVLAIFAERDDEDSALKGAVVDFTLAGSAEYQLAVGQEHRRYPVRVGVLQQHSLV